jgi:hypothetical protein
MAADLAQLVTTLAQRARAASLALATVPRERKDAALEKLADLIEGSFFELLQANQRDLLSPEAGALTAAARDRLTLSEARLGTSRNPCAKSPRSPIPSASSSRKPPAPTVSASARCACPSASSASSTRRAPTSPSTAPSSA